MAKQLTEKAIRSLVQGALEDNPDGLNAADIMEETGIEDLKAVKSAVQAMILDGEATQESKLFKLVGEDEPAAPAPVKKTAPAPATPAKTTGTIKKATPAPAPAPAVKTGTVKVGGPKVAAPKLPEPEPEAEPEKEKLFLVEVYSDGDGEFVCVDMDKNEAKMTKSYQANLKKYGGQAEVRLMQADIIEETKDGPNIDNDTIVMVAPNDDREPDEPQVDVDEEPETEAADETPALSEEEIAQVAEEYNTLQEKLTSKGKLSKTDQARYEELEKLLEDLGLFEDSAEEPTEPEADEEPEAVKPEPKKSTAKPKGTATKTASPVAINELSPEELNERITQSMEALDVLEEYPLAQEMLMRAIGKAKKQLRG